MKSKFVIIFLLFVVMATSGFGCKQASQQVQQASKPITLEYWSVFSDEDALKPALDNFKKQFPYITVKFRKLRYDEYEQALLEAWAEDRGPDIFSINSIWMGKYMNKIKPLPEKISMVYLETQGAIKKEVVSVIKTTNSLSPLDVKNKFIDVVYGDVVYANYDKASKTTIKQIYGLPLSADTLAMFYNRDLLNNANIAELPEYWNREFQQAVKKLTKQNTKGDIIQSGISLGNGANIERAPDLLSALMLQNGATLYNEDQITFQLMPEGFKAKGYNPGLEAIKFYCDFANPSKEVYSWNNSMDNSLKMFTDGKLAITFGYAYHLPTIKSQAPKLNLVIRKLPQIEGNDATFNIANYWLETVSMKSKYPNEAWQLIQQMASAEQAEQYLKIAQAPTALKSLINKQINDENIGIFAQQLLTAKNWYHGKNALVAERVINEMLDHIANNPERLEQEVNLAASKLQQTMK